MTAVAPTAERPHATIPALDGFRSIAIIIVICSHIGLQRVIPGQFGVTLFFFLSGYLITTLLRQEVAEHGGISFRRFYLRRTVRILPPMYLTIAFLALLSLAGLSRPINAAGLSFDLLFLSNYVPVSGIPIGLWSLAVEEHFYLAFPMLLVLLTRRLDFARCAGVCMMLCGAVLAIRLLEVHRGVSLESIGVWSHTRIDSILFGSVLALWNNPMLDRGNVLPDRWGGYALAAALLLPTFVLRDEVFRQTFRYTLQGFGLLVLFNAAIRDRGIVSSLLNNVATALIARWSYTIYLVHSGLIVAFTEGRPSHFSAPALIAVALSVVYAMAMWRWVEKPLAEWRRRRERSLSRPAAVTRTA